MRKQLESPIVIVLLSFLLGCSGGFDSDNEQASEFGDLIFSPNGDTSATIINENTTAKLRIYNDCYSDENTSAHVFIDDEIRDTIDRRETTTYLVEIGQVVRVSINLYSYYGGELLDGDFVAFTVTDSVTYTVSSILASDNTIRYWVYNNMLTSSNGTSYAIISADGQVQDTIATRSSCSVLRQNGSSFLLRIVVMDYRDDIVNSGSIQILSSSDTTINVYEFFY